MIMSTISSAPVAARSTTSHFQAIGLAASLKRWWLAYITWRTQRAAVTALRSMSDRELKDIGLTRSEITGAVKSEVTRNRTFSRYH